MSENNRATPDTADADAAAHAIGGLLDLARTNLTGGPQPPAASRDPSFLVVQQQLAGGPVAPASRPRRAWMLMLLSVSAAVVVIAGGGLGYQAWRAPRLSYQIEGGALIEGGYVRAGAASEAELAFSDGTRVELGRSSRGRVASVGRRGARVLLEQGQARVRVVPRPRGDGEWVFDAGPCRVEVKGTRFDMRWSQEDQLLEVSLFSGTVVVKGPAAPRGVLMQPGQRMLMDVRHASTRLLPLVPPAAAAPTPDAEQAAEDDGPGETPPPPQRRAGGAPLPDWSAQVLAGDFAGVLREARRRGLGPVIARGEAADVMALAEAARLSREDGLARRSLRALVSRFPRSPQGGRALFLLGRLAEDVDGDLPAALRLYQAYLAAAPEGAYRDEVLGRQMTASLRVGGEARARPLAAAYLRLYPEGAYAQPARAILKQGR